MTMPLLILQARKSASASGISVGWTNGEATAITLGMAVYLSGNKTVKKSLQAGPYAKACVHGIVGSASIAGGGSTTGLIVTGHGSIIQNVPIGGTLTAGADVWLDATAGTLSTTQLDPTAAGSVGKFLVRVGTIINYTAGVVADLLFDPSVPVGL